MKYDKNIITVFLGVVGTFIIIWGLSTVFDGSSDDNFTTQNNKEIPLSQFYELAKKAELKKVLIIDNKDSVTLEAELYSGKKIKTITGRDYSNIITLLNEVGVEFTISNTSNDYGVWITLLTYLPIIAIICMIFYFMNTFHNKTSSGDINSIFFGGSAKPIKKSERPNVTLNDVKGIDSVLDKVYDIISFLKYPAHFAKFNAKLPKGILLHGLPGTGKTLLAKALAGEAGVPFMYYCASEFQQMFVGAGPAKVRDMFAEARKIAAEEGMCIIYIDEIDAIAKKRGGSFNDSDRGTLNQLLSEMDGFVPNEGVIVIASTNQLDILDPAVTRPGRFTDIIYLPMPDVVSRLEIFKHFLDKLILTDEKGINLKTAAYATSHLSPALIESVVNQAALIAAKRTLSPDALMNKHIINTDIRPFVTTEDLIEALEIKLLGLRRNLTMTDFERKITAYHEAGHAVVNLMTRDSDNDCFNADSIHTISIQPRENSLGMVVMIPQDGESSQCLSKYLKQICIYCAGRIAEDKLLGHDNVTSGASSDIQYATELALHMVCNFGFSEQIGFFQCKFQDLFNERLSESMKNRAYEEANKIVNTQYKKAESILAQNWGMVEKIAERLLIDEVINAEQLKEMFANVKDNSAQKRLIPEASFTYKRKIQNAEHDDINKTQEKDLTQQLKINKKQKKTDDDAKILQDLSLSESEEKAIEDEYVELEDPNASDIEDDKNN